MDVKEFTAAYREAFGERPELPLLFRYTDSPLRPVEKVGGCFFKALAEARRGLPVSLNAGNIGCGGGKFYTGFSPMPEFVPQFVSSRAEGVARIRAGGRCGDVRRSGGSPLFRGARCAGGTGDVGDVRQQCGGRRGVAFRVRVQLGRGAGRAGEPQRRQEVFSGPFRSVGTPVGGTGCFELRGSDVPLSGDVRHDACKLSVRYACVEQSSRTD